MKRLVLGLMAASLATAAMANTMSDDSFKNLDTNADGKLSASETSATTGLSSSFRTADNDRDGFLSRAEYEVWAASYSGKPAPTDTSSDTASTSTP
jgi:hypothetical protein